MRWRAALLGLAMAAMPLVAADSQVGLPAGIAQLNVPRSGPTPFVNQGEAFAANSSNAFAFNANNTFGGS